MPGLITGGLGGGGPLVTGGLGIGALPPPPIVARDWDVYLDIEARLIATGAFDEVAIGAGPDDAIFSADRTGAVCVISPAGWDELDDAEPEENIRRVTFGVEIVAREDNPRRRIKALERLTSVVQNAIDGQALAGITFPAMTKVRRGRYGKPRNPNQPLSLSGEFAYLIRGHDAHDDSDREED